MLFRLVVSTQAEMVRLKTLFSTCLSTLSPCHVYRVIVWFYFNIGTAMETVSQH